MGLEIRRWDQDDTTVLAPQGDVDRATLPRLRDHLAGLILEFSPHRLVLDLSGLRFMDSAGVHAVLEAERLMESYGGRLAVVTGPDRVGSVFTLTGAHVRVPLLATVDEAVRALGPDASV